MSLVLNVEILGEFKKLTAATTGAGKDLKGLNTNAGKISKSINGALATIGVGFSLAFLIDQFKDSTKAAIDDAKSKELLSKALEDNLGATDNQVAAIENFIGKAQLATGITDDKLRPAFGKLALSSGDLEESMRLMSIATDVAAGTGKDLDTVAQAMAKALEGNTGSLAKLVPSVKDAKDPIQALADTFNGAAEAAAKTDPYAQMEIIFGELQEQVGTALLPILEEFSTWLSTPEGQEKLQEIVDGVIGIITEFTKLVDWISENEDTVIGLGIAITSIVTATKLLEIASKVNAPLIAANYGKMFGWTAAVITALQLINDLNTRIKNEGGLSPVPAGSAGNTFIGSPSGTQPGFSNIGPSVTGFPTTTKPTTTKPTTTPPKGGIPVGNITINNNTVVNTPSTNGKAVVSSLQAYQNQTGATIAKLLK
jgi:hypothetical protein